MGYGVIINYVQNTGTEQIPSLQQGAIEPSLAGGMPAGVNPLPPEQAPQPMAGPEGMQGLEGFQPQI